VSKKKNNANIKRIKTTEMRFMTTPIKRIKTTERSIHFISTTSVQKKSITSTNKNDEKYIFE
jgi:hypothetical protein